MDIITVLSGHYPITDLVDADADSGLCRLSSKGSLCPASSQAAAFARVSDGGGNWGEKRLAGPWVRSLVIQAAAVSHECWPPCRCAPQPRWWKSFVVSLRSSGKCEESFQWACQGNSVPHRQYLSVSCLDLLYLCRSLLLNP